MRRSVLVVAAVVVWSLVVAVPAIGFGTFGSPHRIVGGGMVYGVAAGDMNRDGNVDIIAANDSSGDTTSGHLSLLLGKGNGTFKPAVTIKDPRGPEGVAIGDFNGDGRPDFAVANYNGCCARTETKSSVEIFLGKRGGGFNDNGRIGVGPGAWLIRAADLNRDGKIDLIVGDFKPSNTHGALAVLLGKGDGTFRAPHYYPSGGVVVYGLGVGRMNADERPDVVTASASDTACVLLTRADGRLKPRKCTQTTPGEAGDSYNALALGDFNRDGKLDVALDDFKGGHVFTLLGNGDGTLQSATTTDARGLAAFGIVAGDFNRDGKLDVAVGDQNGSPDGGVWVFLGNGNGTFQAPDPYSGTTSVLVVTAARLNADKGLDLVAGTRYGTVVFLNRP